MADISLERIRKYMLENIEENDLIEVDKVNRYIDLTSQFRKLRIEANKHGPIVETVNATQSFLKANPALEKMATINAQLTSLYKSIKWKMPEVEEVEGEPPRQIGLDDSELV